MGAFQIVTLCLHVIVRDNDVEIIATVTAHVETHAVRLYMSRDSGYCPMSSS